MRIGKDTADDVKRVAATYLTPAAYRLVVVGDAKVVEAQLRDVGPGEVSVRRPEGVARDLSTVVSWLPRFRIEPTAP